MTVKRCFPQFTVAKENDALLAVMRSAWPRQFLLAKTRRPGARCEELADPAVLFRFKLRRALGAIAAQPFRSCSRPSAAREMWRLVPAGKHADRLIEPQNLSDLDAALESTDPHPGVQGSAAWCIGPFVALDAFPFDEHFRTRCGCHPVKDWPGGPLVYWHGGGWA